MHYKEANDMEKIVVQIKNKKAYKILKDLEDLEIIKVMEKVKGQEKKLSEKYAGMIPSDVAEDLNNHVNESRKEWGDRDT